MRRAPLVLLGAALAGCGWRAGMLAPEGYDTIGVEVFETERGILQRELEPELSDAMTEALTDLVDAPLATPARADLLVRGRITAYNRRSGIRTSGNDLAETGLYVAVAAELVDRRTGVVVVPTRERHVWSGYALDESAIENEGRARRRALRNVADTLVLDLFGISTESRSAGGAAVESAGSSDDPGR